MALLEQMLKLRFLLQFFQNWRKLRVFTHEHSDFGIKLGIFCSFVQKSLFNFFFRDHRWHFFLKRHVFFCFKKQTKCQPWPVNILKKCKENFFLVFKENINEGLRNIFFEWEYCLDFPMDHHIIWDVVLSYFWFPPPFFGVTLPQFFGIFWGSRFLGIFGCPTGWARGGSWQKFISTVPQKNRGFMVWFSLKKKNIF